MGLFQKLLGHDDNKREEIFLDEASRRDLQKRKETKRRLALLQNEIDVFRRTMDNR
jgi:hypothetical protein